MTTLHFVDTNILIYRHDAHQVEKQATAARVLAALWQTRTGRISAQVLNEFYVVATRKLAITVDTHLARDEVRQLHAWRPVPNSRELYEVAWEVEDRFELSWWDALVVAAGKLQRCNWLLSEDLQDGQSFDGLVVINPFIHESAMFDLPDSAHLTQS